MNRRATLFIIAAVAAILPAVAVADVMITGQISIVGTDNTPVFSIEQGPNYENAVEIGSIELTTGALQYCDQGDHELTTTVSTIDLQGISNEATSMINVLELVINKGTGMFYLNLTESTLPDGTLMYISPTMMTFNDLMTNGVDIGIGNAPVALAELTVTAGDVFYLGFYLPPGEYAGATATISAEFVA